jgi:hypothetical protein
MKRNGLRYLRRQERAALVQRLEMAVEHGVLSGYGAVESYRREVPVALRYLHRREFWNAFERLYDAAQTRLGMQMGLSRRAAAEIGPRMRSFSRHEGRTMTYYEVAAMLTLLNAADTE